MDKVTDEKLAELIARLQKRMNEPLYRYQCMDDSEIDEQCNAALRELLALRSRHREAVGLLESLRFGRGAADYRHRIDAFLAQESEP